MTNNVIQEIEKELSKLELRSDNRQYIEKQIQTNNSSINCIFVVTNNFWEDLIDTCKSLSKKLNVLILPFDYDMQLLCNINNMSIQDTSIFNDSFEYYFGDDSVVFCISNNSITNFDVNTNKKVYVYLLAHN